jgi:hypothetical protein
MTLIDGALAFAVTVVVPLATGLDGRDPRHRWGLAGAGGVAATSFVFERGIGAATLVAPWAIGVAFLLLETARKTPRTLAGGLRVLPSAYLVVGAGWLMLSRLGARPLGLGDVIVSLTAIHFHYAGFVAPWLVRQLPEAGRSISLARASILVATPVTAAGITVHAALGALGAAAFLVALVVYAWQVAVRVTPQVGGVAKVLLIVSAISIVAGVALAITYALGQWLGTPAPGITTMIRTHGMLNALGFSLCGVLGWLYLRPPLGSQDAEFRRPLARDRSRESEHAQREAAGAVRETRLR